MGGKRIGKWLIISTKGLERRFPSLSLVWVAELQYLCSVKTKNGMKRKTVGIIVAMLVLALAGGIGWNWRDMPQKRLLRAAENRVFTDADSAAHLLAQVDTTRLSEDSRMLFDLMRALVNEERWCLSHADTASSHSEPECCSPCWSPPDYCSGKSAKIPEGVVYYRSFFSVVVFP